MQRLSLARLCGPRLGHGGRTPVQISHFSFTPQTASSAFLTRAPNSIEIWRELVKRIPAPARLYCIITMICWHFFTAAQILFSVLQIPIFLCCRAIATSGSWPVLFSRRPNANDHSPVFVPQPVHYVRHEHFLRHEKLGPDCEDSDACNSRRPGRQYWHRPSPR